MRILPAALVSMLTLVVVLVLNKPVGSLPALAKLMDPVAGWAANAEPSNSDFSQSFSLQGIRQPVTVWFEGRMVPHVHALNDEDLYFSQGFLHAFFRLWQMEFQTHAAAGRLGELVGEKWVTDGKTKQRRNAVLEFDRGQRRKGMTYAAEQSLKAMEAEPRTKQMLDAYTAGVNSYISSLSFEDFPLEYKLMGYEPEPWTNLKCALLIKTMADDLTGYTEDFPLTFLKDQWTKDEFEYLFPQRLNGSLPVIPVGTAFAAPSLSVPPVPADSVWSRFPVRTFSNGEGVTSSAVASSPFGGGGDGAIGSNSWAISGVHTTSGAAILCNDPHLGLNLPALWFEMQLQSADMNVYGVSLPGAPGIIIGFNDSISWGLTNNYRDVKDFFEIEAVDGNFYKFDGMARRFNKRVEVIKIKGQADFLDTVLYTVHGPVSYDQTFADPLGSGRLFAMQWMAHRGTNEPLAIHLLNKAKDYASFNEAILHFQCPAQNILYADRAGNIGMWGQGQFVNKWKDQGRYVMRGNTSATFWGEDIPMTENPHVLNPPMGYLASANQITTDSTYPYWYNGYFHDFRAWRINELLHAKPPNDAMGNMLMQNDVVSILAKSTASRLDYFLNGERDTSQIIANWDYALEAERPAASNFQVFWGMFYAKVWEQFFSGTLAPSPERTMQILLSDSSTNQYYPMMKSVAQQLRGPLMDTLSRLRYLGNEWYEVKGAQLTHLAKLDAFSYKNLKIGGWGNTINAVKKTHGPSWRMIVEMGRDSIAAYGVYPGGQSGNPGSKHYGMFVNHWVEGKYYQLAFLPNQQEQTHKQIRHTWRISSQ